MNKLFIVALTISLTSTVMVYLTFYYGDSSYSETVNLALLLSSPLFIALFMLAIFCRHNFRIKHPLLSMTAISVFSCTAILHISWNSLMLLDVLQKGSLGPGQGYSGLVLWFGSVKTLFWGSVISLFIHYVPLLFRKPASKSL